MKRSTYSESLNKVRDILHLYGITPARIRPKAELHRDLGLKSQDMVSLALDLEAELHTDSVIDQLDEFNTIHDLVQFVEHTLYPEAA